MTERALHQEQDRGLRPTADPTYNLGYLGALSDVLRLIATTKEKTDRDSFTTALYEGIAKLATSKRK